MLLGRVIGTVVPCVVYKGLAGVPMLMVQPLDKRGAPKGGPLVAADSTRMAGPGSSCTTRAAGKPRWRSIPGSCPLITPSSASLTNGVRARN